MQAYDCILVRIGEAALKSDSVRKRWMGVLLDNIRVGLNEKNINFSFELNPNRVFIYSKELKKVGNVLKRIFGVTSFSYCWKCASDMKKIKKLAVDVARFDKLNPRKSFAIRARRASWDKASSQDIAREAGAAVVEATKAKVDLSKPTKEIWIETRSKSTYIFSDYIEGLGGVPLGTSGKVLVFLRSKKDVAAAWLLMKRGCTIVAMEGKKDLMKTLKKWHVGKKLRVYSMKDVEKALQREKIKAVAGKGTERLKKRLILRPLCGKTRKELLFLTQRIG